MKKNILGFGIRDQKTSIKMKVKKVKKVKKVRKVKESEENEENYNIFLIK